MNHIPNKTIVNICDDLDRVNRKIFETVTSSDDKTIRKLIDTRRQLLAKFNSELTPNTSIKQRNKNGSFQSCPDVDDYIDSWTNRIKFLEPNVVNFQNQEFCNLFLDQALPAAWHFGNDILVIIAPPSADIINTAKTRGQKHIVIYSENDGTKSLRHHIVSKEDIYFCKGTDELEKTFALLQAPAKQVITIPCEIDTTKSTEQKQAIANAIQSGKKTRFENTRTVSKFGQSWASNIIHNLPSLANAKNLHDMQVSGVDDAVVVASGPSLNKNVHVLQEIQDHVFIVTALRSLPVLNAAGVTPDLVIQLDAEDDEVAAQLAPNKKFPVKNFLFEPTVNSGFNKIPRDQTIWSLGQHFFDIHKHFGTKPTPFNVPSVSIYGLSLCHFLHFKNICFIGQDLASDGTKQYADGATEMLPAHAKMSMFHIEVPGFYGSHVKTRNSFHFQIKRCTEIAHEWKMQHPEINLVNATEGGAFLDGFDHMSLKEFAKSRNLKECTSAKKITFTDKTPITDVDIQNYLSKIKNTLDRMINIANLIIKLDQQTERTRGLQKKIQKAVQKFQTLNDSTSLVQIAMQANIARVIGTAESEQHIDSYGEFFQKIKSNAMAIKSAVNKKDLSNTPSYKI